MPEIEEDWTTTTTKRGRGESPITPNQKGKQMKIHDYWLAEEDEPIIIIERKQIPPPKFL